MVCECDLWFWEDLELAVGVSFLERKLLMPRRRAVLVGFLFHVGLLLSTSISSDISIYSLEGKSSFG